MKVFLSAALITLSVGVNGQETQDPCKISYMIGALYDDALLEYAEENNGISYYWDKEVGYDQNATYQSAAFNKAQSRAMGSYFTFKVKSSDTPTVYEIRIGDRPYAYTNYAYSGVPEAQWKIWCDQLNVPFDYADLQTEIPSLYTKLKKKEYSRSVNIESDGIDVNVWYRRPKDDKEAPLTVVRLVIKQSDNQVTDAHKCRSFNYPVETKLIPGCMEGDCENGNGKYYDSTIYALYIGGFRDEMLNGYGKIEFLKTSAEFNNVKSYEGPFINGMPCGFGTMHMQDGSKYQGYIKDWKPHGQCDFYPKGWRLSNGDGTQRSVWFVDGVRYGVSKPEGFAFNQCDILKEGGMVTFDMTVFNSAISDYNTTYHLIEDRMKDFVAAYKKAYDEIGDMDGTVRKDKQQGVINGLVELTNRMALYNLTSIINTMKQQAALVNCPNFDLTGHIDKIVSAMQMIDYYVKKANTDMLVCKSRIEAKNEAQYINEQFRSVPAGILKNEFESIFAQVNTIAKLTEELNGKRCE